MPKSNNLSTIAKNNPQTILVDRWYQIRWSSQNKKHYESLGYEYTKQYGFFWAHAEHIIPGSNTRIEVVCPLCNEVRETQRATITFIGHTYCPGCSQVKDISGMRFGRLVAAEFQGWRIDDEKRIPLWTCLCDCGNTHTTRSHSLIGGFTTSCGCYRRELSIERGKKYGKVYGGKFAKSGEDHHWYGKRGSDHPAWNSDLTDEDRIANEREQPEYRQWRLEVFDRDWYQCHICGTNKNIQAHHLYSWGDYPELRYELWNGITLCKKHHKMFHRNFMGRNHNRCTYDDFIKFCEVYYQTYG